MSGGHPAIIHEGGASCAAGGDQDELVVGEQLPEGPRQGEGVGLLHIEAGFGGDRPKPVDVDELDVRRVRGVPALLRRDEAGTTIEPEERQVVADELHGRPARHVLEHVRVQEGVESRRLRVGRCQELLDGVRVQASGSRDPDGVGVVIHADRTLTEIQEVSTEPASDIECSTEVKPSEVPAVGCLNVDEAAKPTSFERGQPLRVGWTRRRGILAARVRIMWLRVHVTKLTRSGARATVGSEFARRCIEVQ